VAASGSAAASVYVWTDKEGRIHITDQPPAKGAKLRDVIEYKPQPAEPLLPSETEKAESQDKEALCRNVCLARRNLRKTKSVALAVRQRAEKARLKVRDLRERIGFDDDEMDDFKDDLKQLEEKATLAEMFAQQAELDVQVAELQVKLAESETDADCDGGY
jgi:hypothetical protein